MKRYSLLDDLIGRDDEADILRWKKEAVNEAAEKSLEDAIAAAAKAFTKVLTGSDDFENLAVYKPVKAAIGGWLHDAFGDLCGNDDVLAEVYVEVQS